MGNSISPDKYSVLYKTNIIVVAGSEVIKIPTSDIVSYSYICNYDTMTYPIFRVRLYTDLSNIQLICDKPDELYVNIDLNGNVYKMNDNGSPTPVAAASSIQFNLKGYIENKNIPTSIMDQYKEGMKTTTDLNENIKYPLEIYCYDYDLIHKSKSTVPAIYKNMSLLTVIKDIFSRVQNKPLEIDELDNNTKYDQILIPGLDAIESLAYLEKLYGLHKKGTQVFGDIDKTYICSTDTNSAVNNVMPIYITSAKNNTDVSGLRKINNNVYRMFTLSSNASVLSESDIEKVINGSFASDINYKEGLLNIRYYDDKLKDGENILTPNIIHPYNNDFVSDMYAARVNERITRIDISGSGYDVFSMKINTRYNIIFESPIRGFDINRMYRASFAAHVFTNMDSDLFIAESTFNMNTN